MARCAGQGFDYCETCINAEHDPFQCEDCEDGDLWEGEDTEEELSIHQVIYMIRDKEAA